MRVVLAAVALLLLAAVAAAQGAPKPVAIAVRPLGDRDEHVVARVFFRFANPRTITDAGLFLEGSFRQAGRVPRNFRIAVPRKHDRFVWANSMMRNGKVTRQTSWALLPDRRNETAMTHMFAVGEAEIEARLVLERDYGRAPVVVAEATETITVARTNQPLPEAAVEEEVAEEPSGAVTIRAPRRNPSGLYLVHVDVLPPVKRVEFWVEGTKVLARNAPPYAVELDLGRIPDRATVRAIGYDAAGRYVDADAATAALDDSLAVTLTRTATPDGMAHFKLSVRKPLGTRLRSVALYSGDTKLHEWDAPPYAVSLPATSLTGADSVRAVVVAQNGEEAMAPPLLPLSQEERDGQPERRP